MEYKYYKEVNSEDRFLFAEEVAEALYTFDGLANIDGQPAIAMVTAYLKEMGCDEKIFCYFRHKGLRRVFPLGSVLLEQARNGEAFFQGKKYITPGIYDAYIGGKKFQYRLMPSMNVLGGGILGDDD